MAPFLLAWKGREKVPTEEELAAEREKARRELRPVLPAPPSALAAGKPSAAASQPTPFLQQLRELAQQQLRRPAVGPTRGQAAALASSPAAEAAAAAAHPQPAAVTAAAPPPTQSATDQGTARWGSAELGPLRDCLAGAVAQHSDKQQRLERARSAWR